HATASSLLHHAAASNPNILPISIPPQTPIQNTAPVQNSNASGSKGGAGGGGAGGNKRNRRLRPCDSCRRKKIRCDAVPDVDPPVCVQCERFSLECTWVSCSNLVFGTLPQPTTFVRPTKSSQSEVTQRKCIKA
ncbi:hypothetical protein BT69DRAFT_1349264, partial [Atractiella rhizophila]